MSVWLTLGAGREKSLTIVFPGFLPSLVSGTRAAYLHAAERFTLQQGGSMFPPDLASIRPTRLLHSIPGYAAFRAVCEAQGALVSFLLPRRRPGSSWRTLTMGV